MLLDPDTHTFASFLRPSHIIALPMPRDPRMDPSSCSSYITSSRHIIASYITSHPITSHYLVSCHHLLFCGKPRRCFPIALFPPEAQAAPWCPRRPSARAGGPASRRPSRCRRSSPASSATWGWRTWPSGSRTPKATPPTARRMQPLFRFTIYRMGMKE